MDEALRHEVRLSLIPGVGPRHRRCLLDYFGSAAAILTAPPSELRRVRGVGPKLASAIAAAEREIDVDAELEACRQLGITVLLDSEPAYPRLLREIHDPPGVLYLRGEFLSPDQLSIAIVGTRHATPYGLQQAERLAEGLSRAGLTIVSGLARGIDGAAHRGALKANGRTIAVLGSGLVDIYPPEHRALAEQIALQGAVVSEAPPRSAPHSGAFPQRNRIITGLSLGVIVVEAALRSGALISATHATEQGREVFAVPGRVDSRASQGCHKLLRDGARLVEAVEDVLEELGPLVESATRLDGTVVRRPAELQLNHQESQVLNAIGQEPTSIDQIVSQSGLPVHRALATISVLEMRHLVKRLSGNLVIRL